MSDNPELDYRINLKEGDKSAEKALERYNKMVEGYNKKQLTDEQKLNLLTRDKLQRIVAMQRAQREVGDELERQRKTTEAIAKTRTETAGDLSSGLGATRTLASTLGAGTGLTGGLEVGDDFFQFVEYLPRLRESMGALVSSAAAAVGGFGPLGLAIGAAALAVGGLAIAYNEFTKDAQRNAELMKRNLDATLDLYRRAAEGATSAEIQADIDALNKRREAELDLLSKAQAQYDATYNAADKVISQQEELDFEFIQQLIKSTTEAEQDIIGMTTAIERGLFAANDMEDAENRITEARKKTLDVIKQLEAQQTALIDSYERQQAALAESRDLQDSRRAEDEELRAARQSADLARQLAQEQQAQQRRLLAIAQQGSQALAAVQKATLERERATVQQIAKLRETANRDALRAEQRYQLERRRAAEDLAFEEFESAIENDISRVLVARSRFNRDEVRASEDFNIEQREREEALALRIAEINAELAEFRQAQNEKRAEIQAQTKAELEAARLEFEEKQRLDQESRDLARQREEEDRALTRSRQEEDRRLEDQRAAEQLSRQLADIETKRIAEVRALGEVISATGQVRRAAGEIAALLSGRSNTPFNRQITSGAGLMSMPTMPANMSMAPASNMSPMSSSSMPSPLALPGGNGVTVNVTGNAFGNVATTETIMNLVGAIKGAFVNGRLGA